MWHLKLVREAIRLGHRPAELLEIQLDALESLVAALEGSAGIVQERPRSRAARAALPAPAASEPSRAIADLLGAAASLDGDSIRDVLAAQWGALEPVDFLESVAAPFMEQVGERWKEGTLSVRHEHLASNRLADFLREARRAYDSAATGPVVAMATTSDEQHEIGLLMASLVFAMSGYRVLYLGSSTPIEQLVVLAREGSAEGIALSFSATAPRAYAFAIVRELRRSIPARVGIWVGGAGAPPAQRGVLGAADLRALERSLSEIRAV